MKRIVVCLAVSVVMVVSFLEAKADEATMRMDQQERLLFDFKRVDEFDQWRLVNDGVMGGVSTSDMVPGAANTAIFKGMVSLENNGGFASTRTRPRRYALGGHHGIRLRVKGDGKTYQFRLRTDDRFDGVSYRYPFTTAPHTWQIIDLPFQAFEPVFRGRVLKDKGPIVPEEIQQIGFLIANRRAEQFRLEIDWIKAYRKPE